MKRFILLLLVLPFTVACASAGEMVTYQVDAQDYEGYYTSPAKDAPFVLLIHDWDGLDAYEIKRSDMLAELGYAVFALDMFGKGVEASSVEKRRELTGALYADRPRMRKLMKAAMETAKSKGANTDNAVAMGYCFGGTCTLELARSGAKLKGFAPFHGGLETPEGQDYNNTKGRIMVFHGTADSNITMDHFAALAKELEQTGVDHEMITYGRAPHAFTVFGSDRYRKEADENSWERFTRFLEDNLKK